MIRQSCCVNTANTTQTVAYRYDFIDGVGIKILVIMKLKPWTVDFFISEAHSIMKVKFMIGIVVEMSIFKMSMYEFVPLYGMYFV